MGRSSRTRPSAHPLRTANQLAICSVEVGLQSVRNAIVAPRWPASGPSRSPRGRHRLRPRHRRPPSHRTIGREAGRLASVPAASSNLRAICPWRLRAASRSDPWRRAEAAVRFDRDGKQRWCLWPIEPGVRDGSRPPRRPRCVAVARPCAEQFPLPFSWEPSSPPSTRPASSWGATPQCVTWLRVVATTSSHSASRARDFFKAERKTDPTVKEERCPGR